MVSARRKLQIVASFGVLLVVAFWVSCDGFFVDPTLTGITVSSLQSTTLPTVGNSAELLASGSYDDGSHKNLTGIATWSVTPTGFVSLSTTTAGLVTATHVTSPGTPVTVQAAEASSNGLVVSGTITITAGTSSSLSITSSPASPISIAAAGSGSSVSFAAALNGRDVTGSTVFSSSNANIINIASASTGTLGGTTGTVTITGSDSTDGASGSIQITVTN